MVDRAISIRRSRGQEDFPRLIEVWRSSVEAAHLFLQPADIAYYEERLTLVYLPGVDLRLTEICGRVVGFSGTHDQDLAMLFVDDEYRGRGAGTALLKEAMDRIPGLVLDVNEQNPQALGFYRHHGFEVVGRSPLDSDGKPHPILHLAQVPGAR